MNTATVLGQDVFERRRARALKEKVLLIPEMEAYCWRLLAGVFRGLGVQAQVMETGLGLELGKRHTSGKECYPCQVTIGDILHHLKEEQRRLGADFDPARYVYFLAEAEGPCRFGMYSKYQRMVLDSYPEYRGVQMSCLSTIDLYGFDELSEEREVADIRKPALLALVTGDMLRRLLWRVRPYERTPGSTESFLDAALNDLALAFQDCSSRAGRRRIMRLLRDTLLGGIELIDPQAPPKPTIGIVGEIYLRTHTVANQDLIRLIERYGGEVVNASVTEWVSYVAYDAMREARRALRLSAARGDVAALLRSCKSFTMTGLEYLYQRWRRDSLYRWARKHADIAGDHDPAHLERRLRREGSFSFDVRTESCLSISGILAYADMGFNGIVNVYPFTCMPGLVVSAIAKPLVAELGVPYLDAAYDESQQSGREAAIRTFMYQASQHFGRQGAKGPAGRSSRAERRGADHR